MIFTKTYKEKDSCLLYVADFFRTPCTLISFYCEFCTGWKEKFVLDDGCH